MAHLKLGEILIQQGLLTQEQLEEAVRLQPKENIRIGELLVKLGLLTPKDIGQALATQLNLPFADEDSALLTPRSDQSLEKVVPYEFAKENLVLPLSLQDNILTCAITDPLDLVMLDNLEMITGHEIRLVISTPQAIKSKIDPFYHASQIQKHEALKQKAEGPDVPTDRTIPVVEDKGSDTTPASHAEDIGIEKLIEKAEEAPIIKLVDLIIRQAIEKKASDIHIEPYKEKISLRYRIDGALYSIPPPAKNLHMAIVSRLKILAKLDIAEKRLPQDGAIAFRYKDRVVDLRISTVPTVWGEKVVMRVLDKSAVPLQLSNLGFRDNQLEKIRKALKSPYGLFFVTGPTGSGKSTTLYAALNETIDPRKNIVTAEDPVEFKIDGINQVGIRSEIGLTFATALRAFLRQDPDVIMVGEVRDIETAQICVRAALTGHFVLSTLHTNDAASAVTRLLDIGIPPYLLTPSLTMVVAQRLARRLCPKCKEPVEVTPEILGGIKLHADLIYKAHGCEECHHTGYQGRIVVTETMPVDEGIKELISKEATHAEILNAARQAGMDTLFEDGIKKVEAGITSLDEILSVTSS